MQVNTEVVTSLASDIVDVMALIFACFYSKYDDDVIMIRPVGGRCAPPFSRKTCSVILLAE